MREIKFRFWHNLQKEMMVGGIHDGMMIDLRGNIGHYEDDGNFQKEDGILMQFTGLKDKNGNPIYEGDLYQVAKNKVYEVKYSEGITSNHEWFGGCFLLHGLFAGSETAFPFDEYAMAHGEVIGNVHENPELITKL